MKLKKIFFLIFLLSFITRGFAQYPRIIDTLEIHNQIKSYGIDEKILNFELYFFSSIIFKNDSTLYYNPNQTLHLFEIHLGDIPKVSKISNHNFSGHNFNRHLFLHNDTLYSYGGQGLFNSSSKLLYFDYPSKLWRTKEIKYYPFDSKKVYNSWKIGNKIMVLLSHFSDFQTTKLDTQIQFSFGEINLENFEYLQKNKFISTSQELLFQTEIGFFRGNYIYDSDLYSLHGYYQEDGDTKWRIFDKIAGSFKGTTTTDLLKPVNGISYHYIIDSTINYRDQHGNIESFDANSGSILLSKDYFELYKPKPKSKSLYYVICVLLIGIVIFYFTKRKKIYYSNSMTSISQTLTEEFQSIENKLKDQQSKTISKEKLDEIFGISHHSYDTIKTRRSSIINTINRNSGIKIERVRSQIDKRFFDYKIS
ncbi:MAG: hypothetical protein CMB82_08425 [Flammeovirgaceae bacterium]|nr:hypothetical protein [Flammeovirgaceae bacterium]